MEHFDLLRYAADVLQTMHLRYFVTGSTATIVYGEVRFTNDIDLAQNRLDLGNIIGPPRWAWLKYGTWLAKAVRDRHFALRVQKNLRQPAPPARQNGSAALPNSALKNRQAFATAKQYGLVSSCAGEAWHHGRLTPLHPAFPCPRRLTE